MAELLDYDTRQQWLKLGRKGSGASDIAGILDQSPWTTPLQVWVSKVSDDVPEVEQTESMEWGHRLEASILDAFSDRTGHHTDHPGGLWQHSSMGWMLATPDAVILDEDYKENGKVWAVVEAKTTNDFAWAEIPTQYVLQVQWQMAVLECDKAFVAVLHRGRHLEIYEVEADPQLQDQMVEVGKAFWFDHVIPEEPPAATGADNKFLADLYPTSREEPVEVDAEVVAEVRAAKDTMRVARSRLDAAEAALKEVMGGCDTAVVGQEVVATWKTQERAEYTVPAGSMRVLRLRKVTTNE
jgi:putative phage-type endonuclease